MYPTACLPILAHLVYFKIRFIFSLTCCSRSSLLFFFLQLKTQQLPNIQFQGNEGVSLFNDFILLFCKFISRGFALVLVTVNVALIMHWQVHSPSASIARTHVGFRSGDATGWRSPSSCVCVCVCFLWFCKSSHRLQSHAHWRQWQLPFSRPLWEEKKKRCYTGDDSAAAGDITETPCGSSSATGNDNNNLEYLFACSSNGEDDQNLTQENVTQRLFVGRLVREARTAAKSRQPENWTREEIKDTEHTPVT